MWLPQRIDYSRYDVAKLRSGKEPEMYLLAHVVNRYRLFRRFQVEVKDS